MANVPSAKVAPQAACEAASELHEGLAEQIISAFGDLARSGLLGASVGEISLRMPGTDQILATPPIPFVEELAASDLLQVTMDGRIVHKRGRASFSLQMHLAIYGQRPDVHAIVHSHAPVATVLGICVLPIPPVTFDAVPFVDLPRVSASNTQDSQWVREVSGRLAAGAPAALLLNHGIVTVGADLHEAVRRTLALEETARIVVVCHLMRQIPTALPAQAVEILRDTLV